MSKINREQGHAGAVDGAVEQVCQRGCKFVLRTIAGLEAKDPPGMLAQLSEGERLTVLAELKSIMAVYGEVACTAGPDMESDTEGAKSGKGGSG